MKSKWRKIRARLCSRAGESISETLVALLVAALALVMLAGAVSTGSNVINKSRRKLEAYYDLNEHVTKRESVSAENYVTGTVTITLTDESGGEDNLNTLNVDVTIYENDEFGIFPVIAYKKP